MAAALWVQGCGGGPLSGIGMNANLSERECLLRAMYFESIRSNHDGLMAVGTVVMNRAQSPQYPNTICGVVGQHRQFAAGVLTRPMSPREMGRAEKAADAILRGERYAPIGNAMHFHMASIRIPYRVQYVGVAGGNAFYLKSGRRFAGRSAATRVVSVPDTAADEATLSSSPPALAQEPYEGQNAAFAGELAPED